MKTLVIHPKDSSTDMLELVYINHPEYTVCRDNDIRREDLKKLISGHDRIIMLGHGTPYGLINSARNAYLIDDSFADLLKTKETLSVWCFSEDYFRRHKMEGFHTGMIISEVQEEYLMLGKKVLNEKEMLENITNFSRYVGECIDRNPEEMKEYILGRYKGEDEVTRFNRERILVI